MRVAAYIIILSLMLVVPVRKLNVAHLEPVEVVLLCMEDNKVCLRTDTDAVGRGDSAIEALKDMEEATPSVIYLDTAEYLLVQKEAIQYVDELRQKLKGSVKVCGAENVDLKISAEYLETHGNLPRLKEWKTTEKLPLWNGKKIS